MASSSRKKLQYKIGEACRTLDIQPYVLRYWETEFPFLKPDKSKSGQRVYSPDEIDVIRRIKELLYDEGYTIAGAKKKLEAELAEGGPALKGRGSDESGEPEADGAEAESADPAADASGDAAGDEGESEVATEVGPDPRVERLRDGLQALLADARELLQRLER